MFQFESHFFDLPSFFPFSFFFSPFFSRRLNAHVHTYIYPIRGPSCARICVTGRLPPLYSRGTSGRFDFHVTQHGGFKRRPGIGNSILNSWWFFQSIQDASLFTPAREPISCCNGGGGTARIAAGSPFVVDTLDKNQTRHTFVAGPSLGPHSGNLAHFAAV